MQLIEIISRAIGKVWKFATTTFFIVLILAIALFGVTVFMPNEILNAIEIFKNLLKIA